MEDQLAVLPLVVSAATVIRLRSLGVSSVRVHTSPNSTSSVKCTSAGAKSPSIFWAAVGAVSSVMDTHTTLFPACAGGRAYGGQARPPSGRPPSRSVEGVDNRTEIREFLATRRAKITPEQVGLPAGGGRRRVPGLRREEVALLAGVSTDYYTRLEKGHIGGVSDASSTPSPGPCTSTRPSGPTCSTSPAPRGRRAAPRGGTRPAYGPASCASSTRWSPHPRSSATAGWTCSPSTRSAARSTRRCSTTRRGPANLARFNFLDPRARDFYPDWDDAAHTSVALLRTEAGRDPHNRDLTDLVGELATRSDEFRTRWAAHDVRLHRTGTKLFHHPGRRRPRARLRRHGAARRPRPDPHRVHRRARLAVGGRAALLASWTATEQLDTLPASNLR